RGAAMWPYQSDELPRGDVEREAIERGHAAEAEAQVADREKCRVRHLIWLWELDLAADVERLGDRFVVVDARVVLGQELLGDRIVIGGGVLDRNPGVHERIFRFVQVRERIHH